MLKKTQFENQTLVRQLSELRVLIAVRNVLTMV